jgi:NitT/TauT family transport system ATP-binding protein
MPEAIVQIRDLTFRYHAGETPVFEDFSWTVAAGERWTIIGPSGGGKTTLLYLLSGLQQPESGEVVVEGAPVPRPRASTGLILQNHGLLPWATVRQNATLGLRIGRFYRNKQGPPGQPRPYPPALPLDEADAWLERLGVAHLRDKYPSQLSGGQQQRVAIARTLALQPNLLLMDEPFSALDAVIREDLQDLVLSLQRDLGITTILVTHSVQEAAILGGRILALGQPPNQVADVVENPQSGAPDFRDSTAYLEIARRLRKKLK